MEEDIIKAREEGIRVGAELAAMHGSDATSQELEKAFFDGCEVGYKKASEELQSYIDLYKDLAEKVEKVAREVIDKYPKWIPITEGLPEQDGLYLVNCNELGGWITRIAFVSGNKFYERIGKEISKYITHWMPLPQPPKDVPE